MAVEPSKKSPPLPWPALIPLGHHAGKPAISLAKNVMLVGSRSNAHLHLLSRHVSKAHALILSWKGQVYIRDLASREKVYINGREVREAWLKDRDLLKIGSFTFKYKDGPRRGPIDDKPNDEADLEVDGADAPLAVAEKVMLIGRRQTCDISLMEASVSTGHAVVFHMGGKRFVRDLGSRTGTFVNGQKIHQHELQPGDTIHIGETDLRYVLAGENSIRPATEEEAFAFTEGGAAEPEMDFVTEEAAPAPAEVNWDAEMIPVHSDEPERVSVAPPPRGASREELDELEDLVGTAPLDMAAEIAREQRSSTPAPVAKKPAEPSDLELIPLDWDELPAPVAKAPVPTPVAKARAPVAPKAPAPSALVAPKAPVPVPAKVSGGVTAGKVAGATVVAAGSVEAAQFLASTRSAPPVVSPAAPIPAPPAVAPLPVFEEQAISFENDPLNVEIEAAGARTTDPASANSVSDLDAELDLLGLDFEADALAAAVNEPAAPMTPAAVPPIASPAPEELADFIDLDAFDAADVSEVESSNGTRAAGFELDPEHEQPARVAAIPAEAAQAATEEAWPAAEGELEADPVEVQELGATWSETIHPVESEPTLSGPVAAEEEMAAAELPTDLSRAIELDAAEVDATPLEFAPVDVAAEDLGSEDLASENFAAADFAGEKQSGAGQVAELAPAAAATPDSLEAEALEKIWSEDELLEDLARLEAMPQTAAEVGVEAGTQMGAAAQNPEAFETEELAAGELVEADDAGIVDLVPTEVQPIEGGIEELTPADFAAEDAAHVEPTSAGIAEGRVDVSAPVIADGAGEVAEPAIAPRAELEPIEEVWSEDALLEELAAMEIAPGELMPPAEAPIEFAAVETAGQGATPADVKPADVTPEAGALAAESNQDVEVLGTAAAAPSELPAQPVEPIAASAVELAAFLPETIEEVWTESPLEAEIPSGESAAPIATDVHAIHSATALDEAWRQELPLSVIAPVDVADVAVDSAAETPAVAVTQANLAPSAEMLAKMEEWAALDEMPAVDAGAGVLVAGIVSETPAVMPVEGDLAFDEFDEMFEGSQGDDVATGEAIVPVDGVSDAAVATAYVHALESSPDEPTAVDSPAAIELGATVDAGAIADAPIAVDVAAEVIPPALPGEEAVAEAEEWDLSALDELEPLEDAAVADAPTAGHAGAADELSELDLLEPLEELEPIEEMAADEAPAIDAPIANAHAVDSPIANAHETAVHAASPVAHETPAITPSAGFLAAGIPAGVVSATIDNNVSGAAATGPAAPKASVPPQAEASTADFAELDWSTELPDSLDATPEADADLSLAEGFSGESADADEALIDAIQAEEVLAVERPPNLMGAEELPLDLEALDEVLLLDEEDEAGAGEQAADDRHLAANQLNAVTAADVAEPMDPERASLTAAAPTTDAGEVESWDREPAEPAAEAPDDFLPLLDLDAGDLAPAASGRNPDALLPLEQVDPDDLDEVMEVEEIVEPTEPTLESALDLEEVTLEEESPASEVGPTATPVAQSAEAARHALEMPGVASVESLSDTAFGQQVAEFTTGASTGEIVEAATGLPLAEADFEELAELEPLEEFSDLEEADLAQAMSADGATDNGDAAPEHVVDTPPGGIEPGLPSAELPEDAGEPTALALAHGGIGAQSFAHAGMPGTNGDALDHSSELSAEPGAGAGEEVAESPADEGGFDSGGYGGFTIGTDLASFIGGMPLVLPALAPTPQFAQSPMAFEPAKGPWGEARPRTATGAALADEVMQAAEGLRDVELMDDDDAASEPEQQQGAVSEYFDDEDAALFSGEGAPSDEWNIGAVLDDDAEPEAPLTPESLTPADVAELEAENQSEESESHQSITETVDGFVGLTHAPSEGPVEAEGISLTATGPADAVIESTQADAEQLEELAELVDEEVGGIAEAQGEHVSTELMSESAAAEPVAWHETPEAEAATLESAAAELEAEAIREAGIEGETALFREVQAEAAALAAVNPPAVEELEPEAPDFAEMPADAADEYASVEIVPAEGAEDVTSETQPEAFYDTPTEGEAGSNGQPAIESVDPFAGAAADLFGAPDPVDVPVSQTQTLPALPAGPAKAAGLSMTDLALGAGVLGAAGGKAARSGGRRGGRNAPNDSAANDVFGAAGEAAPFGGVDDVQQVDVFAQTALGPADSVFAEEAPAGAGVKPPRRKSISPADVGAESARRARGQRAIVPPRLGVLGSGQMATEVEVATPAYGGAMAMPAQRPVYHAPRKRRSIGRIFAMVLLLALLIGGAIAGVWYLVKPSFTIEGSLRFNNLASLTQHQRAQFIRTQSDYLSSPLVRQNAVYSLANQNLSGGFLTRPEDWRIKADFPDDRGDAMVITYTGNDPKDADRVAALMLAVYTENAAAKDRGHKLETEINKLRKQIAEVKQLQAEHAGYKKEVDSAPTTDDVRKLEDLARDAEIQYDIAAAAAKDAKNDVQKLEAQLTPGGAAPATAANDPELAKLQKDLEAAVGALTSAKAAASEEADAKQKALDQAVEAFQQAAANVARENPELAQYVAAVQQLQERTHKLGGDLIARQQSTQQRLERFAGALNESIAAERLKAWAADGELELLSGQLELARRKFNALSDPQSNIPTDSPEVKAAQNGLADLNTKIEARKAVVEKGMALNQAALQLAEMIKENKEQLDSDRKRIETDIKEQEQAFARSGMVEKLPEAQRAAATALKGKQDQITELRKQYAAALSKRTAESNLAVREIEGRIAKLSAQADERKRVLAQGAQPTTPDQVAALQKKQAALKSAEEQAALARKTYLERNKALTAAVGQREAVAVTRGKMEALYADYPARLAQMQQDELTLAKTEEDKRRIVTAVEPRKGDVREIERRDDRLLYSFGASAGVAVIFCVLVLLFSHGGGHAVQPAETMYAEHAEETPMDPFSQAEAGPMAVNEIGAPATERARRGKKMVR